MAKTKKKAKEKKTFRVKVTVKRVTFPWSGPAVKQVGHAFYNKKGKKMIVSPGSTLYANLTSQVLESGGEVIGDPKGSIE